MNPNLTKFAVQMSELSGARVIMKDVIKTLGKNAEGKVVNLSVGNPLILPALEQLWRDCTTELLNSSEYGRVVCRYGSSKGYQPLIEAIANDFNCRYGLNLTQQNILITPGSQSLYFYAANAFGGYTIDGDLQKIVLPLTPEYAGYGRVAFTPEALVAYKPILDIDEKQHRFKYRPDFEKLAITQNTGCVIFSRPCNPTGNILSDEEVQKIVALAANYNVPVLIDSAYGLPFPSLNYTSMTPIFGDNILYCMTLSKAGLPGERIGIAIGDPKLIEILNFFQANLCLSSSRYGQAIAAMAIASGALAELSVNVIRPFYQQKLALLEHTFEKLMPDDLPWFLHRSEGSIFAWLWLRDLPISDWQFYQQLKQAGVIVVPGSAFFPGLQEHWSHQEQCVRISLAASEAEIEVGIERLIQVTRQIYQNGRANQQ